MEYKPEKSNEESHNREDKRIIVKRSHSGFGYTMNLGNKWTWVFNIIILAVLFAVIVARVF